MKMKSIVDRNSTTAGRRLTAAFMLVMMTMSVGISQYKQQPSGSHDVSAMFQDTGGEGEKKSGLLAAALSLVVPGMGELYSGNPGTAKYFLAADGALWLTYVGFVLQSDWLRNDARLFARERAGADFSGKDDKFDVDVGNYESTAAYNEAKLRGRDFDVLYDQAQYSWQWQLESDRLRFRDLRIRSQEASRMSEFVVGALVVNRIISAFSAWRSAEAYNREQAGLRNWYLTAEIQGGLTAAHGVGLRLRAPL